MDAYGFCYAWRRTSPTHNVFPPEVMAQIKPLVHAPAPRGWTEEVYGLVHPHFEDVVSAPAHVAKGERTEWLQTLPISPGERVTVRWGCDHVAVETTWEIFAKYWDDFCYPVSDDVQVFPRSGEWLLLYHETEVFEWGRTTPSQTGGLC